VQSVKYRAGRVFEHHAPDSNGLWDVIRNLRAAGLNPTRVSFDEIDFHDGNGAVDVIRASGVDGGGEAWQWLVQGAPRHAPFVRVINPNGGETFKVGDNIDVKWTSSSSSGKTVPSNNQIKIILLKSDGVSHTIIPGTSNDDSEQMNIPDFVAPGFYKILIQTVVEVPPDLGHSFVIEDKSDDFFRIEGKTQPNRPPVISSCNPDSSIVALDSKAVVRYSISDPDGNSFRVEINWGDGEITDGGISSEWHIYKKTGTFSITIKATDSRGDSSTKSCGSITVVPVPPINNPPVILSCSAPSTITLGQTATVNYAVSDPEGDSFAVTVDWGDGKTSTGGSSSASHTYTSTGTFAITITGRDSRGESSSMSCGTIVVVSAGTNNPPIISTCNLPPSGRIGSTVTLTYAISDPDGDSFTALVNWGDGSTSTGSQSTATHVYTSTGTFHVVITATDSRGLPTSRTCGSITVSSDGAPIPGSAKLKITDVDAKVDGKSDKNLEDNDRISKEAEAESDVEFKVTVKNLYSRAEDLDIEDITVKITIEGIDDDDDLQEESREFDLRPDHDKKVTLNFKLPLNVDEGTFDVIIEAEGEDENGTEHRDEVNLELEVEKEKHDLRFLSFGISPAKANCSQVVAVNYRIINLGQEDEEDSVVEIKNQDLDLEFREEISIDSGTQDNTLSKSVKLKLNNNVEDGIYPIVGNVYSDDKKLTDTKTAELKVEGCISDKKINGKTPKEKVTVISTATEQVITTKTTDKSSSYSFFGFLFGDAGKSLLWIVIAGFILSIVFLFVAIVLFIVGEEN